MVFELHVWVPAFGLPSIDPLCLAAILHFSRALSQEQWVLVASSDSSWSPSRELPALKDDDTLIGGFKNIINYLQTKSQREWNLDAYITSPRSRADITAFSSHILTHLHPLLLLSLYISSENYNTTTRPAYSAILPWPTQYVIPPHYRSIAKTRTDHLGLSSLDLDNAGNENPRHRTLVDALPTAFRTSSPTVLSAVKRSAGKERIRLDALLDVACEPLSQLLGDKKYLLSDEMPTSLDCLALAYLALALKPDVPQKWLQEGLRERYSNLCEYVERGLEECFGGSVQVKDALLSEPGDPPRDSDQTGHTHQPISPNPRNRTKLPWRPQLKGFQAAAPTILHSILDALPFRPSTTSPPSSSSQPSPSLSPFTKTTTALAALAATTASYALYTFLSTNNNTPEKKNLEDMGEAGAMLAGIEFGPPSPSPSSSSAIERDGERKAVGERDGL